MTESVLRHFLLETAREMNRCGLNHGSAGNVSVRLADGFLITPSALPYAECTEDDMVFVDHAGNARGRHKPSSEWRLHRDIYARHRQSNGVLHVHSPWCTTLACLEKGIPSFHYMVAMAGGENIPCAPYALFGSQELSDVVLQTMGSLKACLLAHHGMVCHITDHSRLLPLAIEVESLARVYAQALQIGDPPLLSKAQMAEALLRFSSYRP